MTKSNTIGTNAQDEFEGYWHSMGKLAHLWRVPDAAELFGRNKRVVETDGQPSDYLLTHAGLTSYVEVKGTMDPKGFALSGIRRPQWMHATMVAAAGGRYFFALRAFHELIDSWFVLPAVVVLSAKGKLRWDDIDAFATKDPHVP